MYPNLQDLNDFELGMRQFYLCALQSLSNRRLKIWLEIEGDPEIRQHVWEEWERRHPVN